MEKTASVMRMSEHCLPLCAALHVCAFTARGGAIVARQAEEHVARISQKTARRRQLSQSSDGDYQISGYTVATAYGRLDSVFGEGKIRTVSDQATLVLTREESSNFDCKYPRTALCERLAILRFCLCSRIVQSQVDCYWLQTL